MESKASRSTFTLIFIASLLVHSTLGLLILTMKYAQNNLSRPADIVFYEDTPKASPTILTPHEQIAAQQPPQQSLPQEQKKTPEDDFFKNFPTILPNATAQSTTHELPQSMPGNQLQSAPIDQQQEPTLDQSSTIEDKEITDEQRQEQKEVAHTVATQLADEYKKAPAKATAKAAKKETSLEGSYGEDVQAQRVTLAQIAHTFLQEAKNNPQSFETTAHIQGDGSALPNGKHFAFARYWKK